MHLIFNRIRYYFLLLLSTFILQGNAQNDIQPDSILNLFANSTIECIEFTGNQYCVTMDAGASIDPGNPHVTYFWEFKTDTLYGFEVRKCFDTPGHHIAYLNSRDTISKNINIHDTLLTFEFAPKAGINIQGELKNSTAITFENNLYANANRKKIYMWDLGEAGIKFGAEATVVFRSIGTKTIKLYILNPMGPELKPEKCLSKTIEILPNR